jgi:hypothetical protein
MGADPRSAGRRSGASIYLPGGSRSIRLDCAARCARGRAHLPQYRRNLALRFEEAERHLEQLVSLARRIDRPYLEFWCLVHWVHGLLLFRPEALQPERVGQAIELAERNGWDQVPLAGIAYTVLAGPMLYQGRLAEAEPWLERQMWNVTALLLEARARDRLGDQAAAGRALERALDITGSSGMVLPFLLDPAPALLERHRRHGTAHPALISQILDLPAPEPGGHGEMGSAPVIGGGLRGSAPRGKHCLNR